MNVSTLRRKLEAHGPRVLHTVRGRGTSCAASRDRRCGRRRCAAASRSPCWSVLAVVLVAVGLVVDTVFRAQADRNVDALLTARVQLAQQLAQQDVAAADPPAAASRRGGPGSLALPDGTFLGAADLPPDARIRQVTRRCPGRRGSAAPS